MAGDNTVSVEFIADSSQLVSSMGKAEAAMAAWRAETGLAAQPTIDLGRKMVELGGTVGKTAANFRPATQAQRDASVAMEEGSQKATSLISQMVKVGLAYQALKIAKEAATAIIDVNLSMEEARTRFVNLAGGTQAATDAFNRLGAISKATNTQIIDLSKAETTLQEAGVQLGPQMDNMLTNMAEKAKAAGSDVGTLADMYLRLATRQELSGRQIAALDRMTGDESQSLSKEYQEMSVSIPRAEKAMELLAVATGRAREDAEKMNSAQSSFGEQHFGKQIEDQLKATGGAGNIYLGGTSGETNAAARAQTNVRQGIAQLGKEGAGDTQSIQGMIKSGEIGYAELIAASSRYHEAEQTRIKRDEQDAKSSLEIRKEFIKTDLAGKGETALTEQSPAGAAAYAAYQKTGRGREDQVKVEATQAATWIADLGVAAGKAADSLSRLFGYDPETHPVKGMQPSDQTPIVKKPGAPGFDWGTYHPGGTSGSTSSASIGDIHAELKTQTGILQRLFTGS